MQILDIKNIDNDNYRITAKHKEKILNFILNYSQLQKLDNFLICILFYIYNKIELISFLSITKTAPLIEGRGLYNKITFNNKKITLIDESYNANPQTMKNAVNYVKNLSTKDNHKKFLVLGEMLELGENKLKFHIDLLNYILEKKLDNVIICGELMKFALEKFNDVNIICIMNIKSILTHLKKKTSNGDIILIKGSNSSLTNELAKVFLFSEAK